MRSRLGCSRQTHCRGACGGLPIPALIESSLDCDLRRRVRTRRLVTLVGLFATCALVSAGKPDGSVAAVSQNASLTANVPKDGSHVVCNLYHATGVACVSASNVPNVIQRAKLLLNGEARLCPNSTAVALAGNCSGYVDEGDFATPVYGVGKRVSASGFSCVVLETGVQCIVIATGKGFLINRSEVIAVAVGVPPTPRFGHTATLKTVSGTVLVKQPGSSSFVSLSNLTSVPLGTTVDTSNGTVQLGSAKSTHGGTQTGQFYGSVFKVTQTKARSQLRAGRSVGITELSLAGGAPSGCTASSTSANMAVSRTVRRLWGNGHGNFRTTGRYASATVRGTKWLTEDSCTGTLVKVDRGVVAVENTRTHKTVLVRAGHSSVVRSPSAASASAPCTKPALEAALTRSNVVGRIAGNGFGCAEQFAYAAVLVHIGTPNEVEITTLFRAAANEWRTVRRSVGECRLVPKKIRRPACESN
jgi:hypothetical protein